MCETLKKNKKNTESSIDEYMNCITFNCENNFNRISRMEIPVFFDTVKNA